MRRWQGLFNVFLCCLTGSFVSITALGDVVYVAFGDSITAGAWSFTSLPEHPLSEQLRSSGPDAFSPLFFERKGTLSWATGSRIRSFATMLKSSFAVQGSAGAFHTFNVSRSWVPAGDLDRQMKLFHSQLSQMSLNKDSHVVATLLIGANDLCGTKLRWTESEQIRYRSNVQSLIKKLGQLPQFQTRRLLISSLPRITRLADQKVRNANMVLGFTCSRVRDQLLSICPSMVKQRTFQERQAQDRALDQMNQELSSIASSQWSGIEVAFSRALDQQELLPEQLANDCFHPNARGHERIASEIWASQPWF